MRAHALVGRLRSRDGDVHAGGYLSVRVDRGVEEALEGETANTLADGFFSIPVGASVVAAASACGCACDSVTSGSVRCPNDARPMLFAAATDSIHATSLPWVAKALGPGGP